MTERLSIRKFGPIQDADIEVRDLTIFVGPQATGKSTAAQLLYFMRGVDDLLPSVANAAKRKAQGEYEPLLESPATQELIATLEWWLGNNSAVFAQLGTLLSWCPSTTTETITYDVHWTSEKRDALSVLKDLHVAEKGLEDGQSINVDVVRLNYFLETWVTGTNRPQVEKPGSPQIYIPAGRALYSYLPLGLAFPLISRSKNRPEWPGYIYRFYQTLENTIRSLWEYQENSQGTLNDTPTNPFLMERMEKVLRGRVRYGPNAILLKTGGKILRPDTIAAGQMEAWPFFAILEDAIHKGETEKLRIYFDEPEAHLHPGAQRVVMEIIAALVRSGAQVVLTTHSPYILYALNNSLAAGEVLDKGRSLPPELPAEIALLPQQVAAYCFSSDGQVRDIMDREVGLIDSAELNRVAEELGTNFTAMQELLLDDEPERND